MGSIAFAFSSYFIIIIQAGHMNLHAMNMAVSAVATDEYVYAVESLAHSSVEMKNSKLIYNYYTDSRFLSNPLENIQLYSQAILQEIYTDQSWTKLT